MSQTEALRTYVNAIHGATHATFAPGTYSQLHEPFLTSH